MGFAVGPRSPGRPSGKERQLSLLQPSSVLGLAGVTHGGQGMDRLRDTWMPHRKDGGYLGLHQVEGPPGPWEAAGGRSGA